MSTKETKTTEVNETVLKFEEIVGKGTTINDAGYIVHPENDEVYSKALAAVDLDVEVAKKYQVADSNFMAAMLKVVGNKAIDHLKENKGVDRVIMSVPAGHNTFNVAYNRPNGKTTEGKLRKPVIASSLTRYEGADYAVIRTSLYDRTDELAD